MAWWCSSARRSSSRTRRFSCRWLSLGRWTGRPWLQLVSELAVFERWLMTDDKSIHDEKPGRGETELDDASITKRVPRQAPGDQEHVPDTSHESAPPVSGGIVQQFWRRIQEERSRPKRVEI